ncbi:MAG: efflux RND transporter periplasmic adaptor subunit [Limnobacter sp.]|nr:efflux RND transporter periplasmic adaptor subunit [Limnobacter sp.]
MSPNTTTLFFLGSLFVLSACGPQSKPEPAQDAPVRAVQAERPIQGPAVSAIEISGVSSYRDEARLSFKVGGVVEGIEVREGQHVKKGERLAWLNKKEVNAAVAQAQAGYDKAKRDYTRGVALREKEVITQVQLNDLKTQLDLAQAQLTQAQFAAQTAEVVAPTDAVVLRRLTQATEVVAPGQPVVIVGSQASGFVFKASLTDAQAVKVSLGNSAVVQFDAHPGSQWPGKVIELSQAADPATGTYGVQIQLNTEAHPDKKLLSGLSGRANIKPTGYEQTRQYLPLGAIVEGNNEQAWIFIVNNDLKVQRKPVSIEFVSPVGAAISEALPKNVKVVTSGASYLRDGESVQIVEN